MQNIHNILNIGFRELKNSLIKNPKLDAEVLLSHVLNKSLKEMIIDNVIKPNNIWLYSCCLTDVFDH